MTLKKGEFMVTFRSTDADEIKKMIKVLNMYVIRSDLFDRFDTLKLLGTGSSARVYLVRKKVMDS
jgi:hypothetical protein